MLNIDKVETVYLACGYTDLRKSVDGLGIGKHYENLTYTRSEIAALSYLSSRYKLIVEVVSL